LDFGTLFKCESGLFSAAQILGNKDNNMDFMWGIMVVFDLTFIFNIYIFLTEIILGLLHRIKTDVNGSFVCYCKQPWVKLNLFYKIIIFKYS
jgi:hypothetical protein